MNISYGWASLLLETINNNLGLNIDKYVDVNFESFKTIIDIIGGVEIDVLPKEVSYIPGIYINRKANFKWWRGLEYIRIRYIDSTYMRRDKRQRTVIESVYKKLRNYSLPSIFNILNSILEYTKTNLFPIEIFKLSKEALKINNSIFEQLEFSIEKEKLWIKRGGLYRIKNIIRRSKKNLFIIKNLVKKLIKISGL